MPPAHSVLLLVVALAASGCVRRYTRIVASSTPPLARVSNSRTDVDYGPAPAFIDLERRFFLLAPKRRKFSLTFEILDCPVAVKSVTVADWVKTPDVSSRPVTEVHATMQGCGHAGP